VTNLRILVLDRREEEQRNIRYSKELSDLRTLLTNGNFRSRSTGDALLREYP